MLCARSIEPFEGGRWRLRWIRANGWTRSNGYFPPAKTAAAKYYRGVPWHISLEVFSWQRNLVNFLLDSESAI